MAVTGSLPSYPRACCAFLVLLLAMAAVHADAAMTAETSRPLETSRCKEFMDLSVCGRGATNECCEAIQKAGVEIACICKKLKSMNQCDVAEKCKSRCPITCRACDCPKGVEEAYAY